MVSLTHNRFTRLFGRSGQGDRRLWLRLIIPALLLLVIAYLVYLTMAFSVFYGRDIYYPQKVLADFERAPRGDGATVGELPDAPEPTGQDCQPSRTVAMQIHLIDLIVNENMWVPARPLYKLGFFGVVDFEDTPWFDNKAAEEIGMLDILRRVGIELTDSLGRVRGTSTENENLNNAHAALRINERAWYINNPFSGDVNTVSPSAAESYRSAIPLYEAYNEQLTECEAVFDARTDNLREVLSRLTATLGSTVIELAARSQSIRYDVQKDRYVNAAGNDRAWLDFRADNHFHRARGKMFALHGILQGMRADFATVITDSNLQEIWDKMETTVAEAALPNPMIVSNGSKDGLLFPDHLGVLSELILRARTSMVELRDVLRD